MNDAFAVPNCCCCRCAPDAAPAAAAPDAAAAALPIQSVQWRWHTRSRSNIRTNISIFYAIVAMAAT